MLPSGWIESAGCFQARSVTGFSGFRVVVSLGVGTGRVPVSSYGTRSVPTTFVGLQVSRFLRFAFNDKIRREIWDEICEYGISTIFFLSDERVAAVRAAS